MHQLDIAKLLRCCVLSAVCSQRYVLNDMLRIQETIKSPSGVADAPHHHKPSADADAEAAHCPGLLGLGSDSEDGDDTTAGMDLAGSVQLSKAQQQRVAASIHNSLDVESKGSLSHRATSTVDLVTNADTLVQHVVVAMLQDRFGSDAGFTIVGEEEGPVDDKGRRSIEACLCYAKELDGPEFLEGLTRHMAVHAWCPNDHIVEAPALDALQARVTIFIDPIDGTNAFVEGELHVPMTLIGIAVDGLPVAGVVNRVFVTDAQGAMHNGSLSVACASLQACSASGKGGAVAHPYVMVSGVDVSTKAVATPCGAAPNEPSEAVSSADRVLATTYSSSTKTELMAPLLHKLQPISDRPARGAGYKLMMVVDSIAGPPQAEMADVFLTPNAAIKKWDTCAPHAILRALGGRVTDVDGVPVRYPVVLDVGTKAYLRQPTISLDNGFIGTANRGVLLTVAQRLSWSPSVVATALNGDAFSHVEM